MLHYTQSCRRLPRAFPRIVRTTRRTFSSNPRLQSTTADDERQALIHRQLPEMTLSSGTKSSLTAPRKLQDELKPKERAVARFQVEGNAISM